MPLNCILLKRINSLCGIIHFEIYHLEKVVLLLICVRKIVFLIYMSRFLRRKNLLLTLRADDLSLLETAPKRWESLETPSGEESISGKPINGKTIFCIYSAFRKYSHILTFYTFCCNTMWDKNVCNCNFLSTVYTKYSVKDKEIIK